MSKHALPLLCGVALTGVVAACGGGGHDASPPTIAATASVTAPATGTAAPTDSAAPSSTPSVPPSTTLTSRPTATSTVTDAATATPTESPTATRTEARGAGVAIPTVEGPVSGGRGVPFIVSTTFDLAQVGYT